MLEETGLVLEGGGMRGVYTAGVLEYLLEQSIFFPYVIGVSAGACNAASYLSKQKGRNKTVNIDYVTDPRYLSWKNYLKHRQLFGMDFIFEMIPNQLVPYHYEEFHKNPSEFVIGTTDCKTGKPIYFGKKDYGNDLLTILKASSSLPFIAPEIHYGTNVLLDGGISDPIPIRKAEKDGFKRNIVILTRNRGYMKKSANIQLLLKWKYPQYSGLHKALAERYKIYNETLDYLEAAEERGTVIIVRPEEPLEVGRTERNPKKLEKLYLQGYKDAQKLNEKLKQWG